MWKWFFSIVVVLIAGLGWMHALAAVDNGKVSVTKGEASIVEQGDQGSDEDTEGGTEKGDESGESNG